MHLSLNAVACAMRTKNSGVQDRRARSARYPERTQCCVVRFSERVADSHTHPGLLSTQVGQPQSCPVLQ